VIICAQSKAHSLALVLALMTSSIAVARSDGDRLNVAFVVWDGMELIECMGPAHIFSFAPGMDEYTVSATTASIESEFITIVPEYTFDNCPLPDVIVIPGGSIWIPMSGKPYRDWLTKHVPRATLTVSVCNSAVLLADLGLLNGKEATCGRSNLDDIMLLGKDVRAYINRRWVHSGNIITTQSYLAGIDSSIYAVRVLRGAEGERQVLGWSNYSGDLSQYETMHAEPGIVPISRRRETVKILQRDGVDEAVAFYREWVESGRPAYTPPLGQTSEADMFQWMAWGNQRLGRHNLSLRICQFKVRIWPESARERAYLGEALMHAGRLEQSLTCLLEALSIDEENHPALVFARELLAHTDLVPSVASRRVRAILRRHPQESGTVLIAKDEPGIPLRIAGHITDSRGHPIADAVLHVYHADREGKYTPTAAADESNARLFAYIRADDQGTFTLQTIRPGYTPGSPSLPQHIHIDVCAPGYAETRTQLYFADDPRVDAERRRWIERRGCLLLDVSRDDDGIDRVACTIKLRDSTESTP
jgi:putative intracellular protease/amidase/tetratricopeptide (TPR) repeat protein